MEIMFQTTGRCNLNCVFCAYRFLDRKRHTEITNSYIPYNEFTEMADKCIDFGFNEFQMTPVIGEPAYDTSFISKLRYLNDKKEVKRISFFTNLMWWTRSDVKAFLSLSKATVTISIYGYDRKSFIETAGKDSFKHFEISLVRFAQLYRPDSAPLEFFIRCPDWKNAPDGNQIKSIVKVLSKIKPSDPEYYKTNHIVSALKNGNWCGLIPDGTLYKQMKCKKRKGICQYSLMDNSIDAKGDILLCGACDVEKKTVIGNVHKQSLEEVYSENSLFHKILEGQLKGGFMGCCEKCSEHHELWPETLKEWQEKLPWIKKLISK